MSSRQENRFLSGVIMMKIIVSIIAMQLLVSVSAIAAPHNERAPRIEDFETLAGPAMENFNRLEGVWSVESHSLANRMADDEVWLENHMETTYRVLLDGLVVVNDTYGTFNDRPMHGIMIRAYDPDKDEWQFSLDE